MEIERKFLIKKMPDLGKFKKLEIEQGYISEDPVIRIRKSNSEYILTVKHKIEKSDEEDNSIVCGEFEINIPEGTYQRCLSKVIGSLIYKTRYIIPLSDGLIAELDVFKKQLQGLVFAEVEFPSIKEANSFVPPDWFGEDVSHNDAYKNVNMIRLSKYNPKYFA